MLIVREQINLPKNYAAVLTIILSLPIPQRLDLVALLDEWAARFFEVCCTASGGYIPAVLLGRCMLRRSKCV